jgi:hypothetical protein
LIELKKVKLPKEELEKICQILEETCPDFLNKYSSEKGGKYQPISDREIIARTLSLLIYWDDLTDALDGIHKRGGIVDIGGEGINPLKLERLSNKYRLLTVKDVSGKWKYVLEPSYDFERNFRFLVKESIESYPNDLYLRASNRLLRKYRL